MAGWEAAACLPGGALQASDREVLIMSSTMAENNPQGRRAICVQATDPDIASSIMWNQRLEHRYRCPRYGSHRG
jgi:hypothetical protein